MPEWVRLVISLLSLGLTIFNLLVLLFVLKTFERCFDLMKGGDWSDKRSFWALAPKDDELVFPMKDSIEEKP